MKDPAVPGFIYKVHSKYCQPCKNSIPVSTCLCFFHFRCINIKYNGKLTKEQFEELNEEFAVFLAAQSIDAKEWTKIKEEKPELAEKQLEVFSDFVWEKVLNKTGYLEHFSSDSLNLFKCNEKDMERIVVKVNKEGVNLMDAADFDWLLDNSKDPRIEYLKGKKPYASDKNQEIFDLIQKGGVVSDGKLFEAMHKMLSA